MGERNDGGPAFPVSHPLMYVPSDGGKPEIIGGQGMTLRDWLAGQALAGICANSHTPWAPDAADVSDEEVARASYDIARAMLAEREKGDT